MTNEDFEQIYYPKYRVEIAKLANKLIGSSMPDLVPDLVQEGMICLWKLDLKGVSNEDSYIRQAVKFTMIDYLRKLPRDSSRQAITDSGGNVGQAGDDFNRIAGSEYIDYTYNGCSPATLDDTLKWVDDDN